MNGTLVIVLIAMFLVGAATYGYVVYRLAPDRRLENNSVLNLRIDHEFGHHSSGYRPKECPMCQEEDTDA